MAEYTVSKDKKTISIGGKTYSLSAFEKQFIMATNRVAVPDKVVNKPIKIDSNPTKSGKTRIGKMAGGLRGGLRGGMAGGMNWQTK